MDQNGGDGVGRIVFADAFNFAEESYRELAAVAEIVRCDLDDRPGLMAAVGDAEIVVAEYARVDEALMAAAPRLRGVVVYGVGTDHIDLEAAAARGLTVRNTGGANANAVAELTFGLLLNCLRGIHRADRYVRAGGWTSGQSGALPDFFHGTELRGRVLGLVGFGNIGRRVAEIAAGFGMVPFHWQPRPAAGSAVPYLELGDLIARADVLSVHCSLNGESRGLLSRERLGAMKRGAVLLATSRGGIVDEEALADLLESGHIAAAGLDVFADEPILRSSPLLGAPNVVLTPHIGGSTAEAETEIARKIVGICREMLGV